jgi:hypothetical protein
MKTNHESHAEPQLYVRNLLWPPTQQPILTLEIYRDLTNVGMFFLEPRHELLVNVGAHL